MSIKPERDQAVANAYEAGKSSALAQLGSGKAVLMVDEIGLSDLEFANARGWNTVFASIENGKLLAATNTRLNSRKIISAAVDTKVIRYGDFMRPLDVDQLQLSDDMRSDAEVMRYIVLHDKTLRAEKVSDFEDWTQEETDAYRTEDWRKFSRLRGYSEAEISDYADYVDLSDALVAKYGDDDVAWIGYTIQEQTGVLGLTPKQVLGRE